jgi:hypothetical protein
VPGTYHFRFLKNVGSHIVWLDVTDDSNALPMFQGSIFIKVSRVSAPSAPSSSFSSGPVPVSTAPQAAASAPAVAAPTGGISPPAKAPKPDMGRRNSEKLISFEEVASPVSPSTAGMIMLLSNRSHRTIQYLTLCNVVLQERMCSQPAQRPFWLQRPRHLPLTTTSWALLPQHQIPALRR